MSEQQHEVHAQTEAESGIIVNAAQMQSLDVSARFTRTRTTTGWRLQLEGTGRVTVNFITSMRKFEIILMQDDTIERDGDDLIIVRNRPADAYSSQRGTSASPLARATERITTPETGEGRTD